MSAGDPHLSLDCVCETLTHGIRFSRDPDFGTVEVAVHLGDWLPFHKRAWLAVKYVFRFTHANNYQYDCAILKQEDVPRLIALLEQAK